MNKERRQKLERDLKRHQNLKKQVELAKRSYSEHKRQKYEKIGSTDSQLLMLPPS